jgi:hypothetical protein
VLKLSTASIEEFYEHALARRASFAKGDDLLEAFICVFERARVSAHGHIYTDPYVFIQLSAGSRGACFAYPDEVDISDSELIIGQPVWDVFEQAPDYIKVAILDAIYVILNNDCPRLRPDVRKYFRGTAAEKSSQRAESIVNLIAVEPGMRLCMIGVIEDIVCASLESGAEVALFDHLLAGETFMGREIGRDAGSSLDSADYVLVTGNALKTRTMDDILQRSAASGIPTTVYAMSGANLAPHYLSLGVESVTCETFPYYWYSGLESVMDVYRRK